MKYISLERKTIITIHNQQYISWQIKKRSRNKSRIWSSTTPKPTLLMALLISDCMVFQRWCELLHCDITFSRDSRSDCSGMRVRTFPHWSGVPKRSWSSRINSSKYFLAIPSARLWKNDGESEFFGSISMVEFLIFIEKNIKSAQTMNQVWYY